MVIDAMLMRADQARQGKGQLGADVALDCLGVQAQQQLGADQPRGNGVHVRSHMDRAEARDAHLHFLAGNQWQPGQRTQRRLLLVPAGGPGAVTPGKQITDEAPVVGPAGKLAAASHAQGLIERLLEAVMGLFDIAVFVGNALIVPGGLHPVMGHERLVARRPLLAVLFAVRLAHRGG